MSQYLTNRKWVIIPSCFVTCVNFQNIYETNIDSLRYSLDKSKTFIKYVSEEKPDFLLNITSFCNDCMCDVNCWCKQGITEYSHQEILAILSTTEWTSYDDIYPSKITTENTKTTKTTETTETTETTKTTN